MTLFVAKLRHLSRMTKNLNMQEEINLDKIRFRGSLAKCATLNNGNKNQILARNPLIFTVVRHPYERLVSAYADFTDKPRSKHELKGTFQVGLNISLYLAYTTPTAAGLSERTSAGKDCGLQCDRILSNQPALEFSEQPLLVLLSQLHRDLEDGDLR